MVSYKNLIVLILILVPLTALSIEKVDNFKKIQTVEAGFFPSLKNFLKKLTGSSEEKQSSETQQTAQQSAEKASETTAKSKEISDSPTNQETPQGEFIQEKETPDETVQATKQDTEEEDTFEIPEESDEVALPSLEDLPEDTIAQQSVPEEEGIQKQNEEKVSETIVQDTESEETPTPSLGDSLGDVEKLKAQLLHDLEKDHQIGTKDQGLKAYMETKSAESKKKFQFRDMELRVVGHHSEKVSGKQIKRDVSSSKNTPKTK